MLAAPGKSWLRCRCWGGTGSGCSAQPHSQAGDAVGLQGMEGGLGDGGPSPTPNPPFPFQIPPNLPCSVTLQPGPEDTGKVRSTHPCATGQW